MVWIFVLQSVVRCPKIMPIYLQIRKSSGHRMRKQYMNLQTILIIFFKSKLLFYIWEIFMKDSSFESANSTDNVKCIMTLTFTRKTNIGRCLIAVRRHDPNFSSFIDKNFAVNIPAFYRICMKGCVDSYILYPYKNLLVLFPRSLKHTRQVRYMSTQNDTRSIYYCSAPYQVLRLGIVYYTT